MGFERVDGDEAQGDGALRPARTREGWMMDLARCGHASKKA
jgi:hypothetical protein